MPRRVPGLVAFAAVLLLLLAFLAARFPWERLLPALVAAAERASGAAVEVGSLGLGLGWAGPELVAREVTLAWPLDPPLAVDAVALRPAWSPAWLLGRPRWHLAASGPPGTFLGELAPDRVAGRLVEVDVGALPWTLLGTTPPLDGRISATLELDQAEGLWLGWLQLHGATGSVALQGMPVAIPYERLEARIDLAAERAELSRARLEGPLVTARFGGGATPNGAALSSWPLDLEVQIERIDPALAGYLPPLGIQLDPEGGASLRVTGSLDAPYLSAGGRGS